MSYPELERLIEGLNKNAEREAKEIENASSNTRHGDSNDLVDFIKTHGGGF